MKIPHPDTYSVVDFPPTGSASVGEHTALFSPGKVFQPDDLMKPLPPIEPYDFKNDYALIPFEKTPEKTVSGHQPVDPWAPEKAHLDIAKLDAVATHAQAMSKLSKTLMLDLESYAMEFKTMAASTYSLEKAWQKLYQNDFQNLFADDTPGFGFMPMAPKAEPPLPPRSLDIPYRPFQPFELASREAFMQAFFDRAVAAMTIQQATAHTVCNGRLSSCEYRTHSGARCVVGWMIPDETYSVALEGKRASHHAVAKAIGVPVGLTARGVGGFMDRVQYMLHDSLCDSRSRSHLCETLEANIKAVASQFNLRINTPVR